MNKKSFFLGMLVGIVLSIVGLLVLLYSANDNRGVSSIRYFEHAESYENKTVSSFRVFQTLNGAALANEEYSGTLVMVLGEGLYDDQVVKVNNPQVIGTYSYTTNSGIPKTVPVIVSYSEVNK